MEADLYTASSTNATVRYQWLKAKYDVYGYNSLSTELCSIIDVQSSDHTDIRAYSNAILSAQTRITQIAPEAALSPQLLSLCFLKGLDSKYDSWKDTFMQDYLIKPRDDNNKIRYPTISTMVDQLINMGSYSRAKTNIQPSKSLSTKQEKSRFPSPKDSSQKSKSDKCTHCGNPTYTVAKCYYKDIKNAPADWLQYKDFKTQADADKWLKERNNRPYRKYNSKDAQSST